MHEVKLVEKGKKENRERECMLMLNEWKSIKRSRYWQNNELAIIFM